jgi:hypothetical protein
MSFGALAVIIRSEMMRAVIILPVVMRPVSMLLTGPAVKFTKVFDAASSGFKNFVGSAVFIPSSDLFPHHGDDRLKRKAIPNAKNK